MNNLVCGNSDRVVSYRTKGDKIGEIQSSSEFITHKKYERNHFVLSTDKNTLPEESIHDLDIENCNRIILSKAREVAQVCKDLGIAFRELEYVFVSTIARILQNAD